MTIDTRRLSRSGRTWRLGPRAWRNGRRPALSRIDVAIAAALLLSLAAFLIACVFAMSYHESAEPELAAADAVPTGEDVALAMATFADGQARFYRYVTATGQETRFFIVKSRDGAVHAALDACDSCFRDRRGFRQAGDHLICNRCGRAVLPQHVNVLRGGCNPLSVDHTVEGERVIIRAAVLEQGGSYF